jgi:hypothetical protein
METGMSKIPVSIWVIVVITHFYTGIYSKNPHTEMGIYDYYPFPYGDLDR